MVLRTLRRFPLVAFFLLAFALSWWAWPLAAVSTNPDSAKLFHFGVIIATAIVSVVVGEFRRVFGKLLEWRVAPQYYLFALLAPVGLYGTAVLLHMALGGPSLSSEDLGDWYILPLAFLTVLFFGGALSEEPGWRGFALPHMVARMPSTAAALALGLIWAIWHAPLLIGEENSSRVPVPFVLSLVGQSVLYAWLYGRTKASLLLAILFHAASNTLGAFFFRPYFEAGDPDYARLWWLYTGITWAVALVLVLTTRGRLVPPDTDRVDRGAEIATVGASEQEGVVEPGSQT